MRVETGVPRQPLERPGHAIPLVVAMITTDVQIGKLFLKEFDAMRTLFALVLLMTVFALTPTVPAEEKGSETTWLAGIGRRVITPQTPVWLAGYGTKRPPEGKIHDLWVKTLALRTPEGKTVVLATTDHMGMSKTIYESLQAKVQRKFSLARADFMLAFSHNHSGPILKDDLEDYYPLDDEQRRLVAEYSEWMENQVVDSVGEALDNLRPARLWKGDGRCTFAVNRRENTEADVRRSLPPEFRSQALSIIPCPCWPSRISTASYLVCCLAMPAIR